MTFPVEDFPAVAAAATAVRRDAKAAGVWVFSAGLHTQVPTAMGTDGKPTDRPYPGTAPHLGGFAVVEVPTRDEAHAWAARLAEACRCAQEVYELMDEPIDD